MAAPALSGIYEIVNLVNGKRYVGSAVRIHSRWAVHLHHLRRGKHHSSHLQRAWVKHGESAFKFNVLCQCDRAELVRVEQSFFDSLKPEYNIAPKAGNCLGVKWTAEQRARASARQKANPAFKGRKHAPETIEKMSQSQKGRPSPMKGRKRRADAVLKTAEWHRGKTRTDETRRKIAAKALGRPFVRHSDEYRKKLSAALKGKAKSTEHMAALQAGRAKRVYSQEQRERIAAKLREQYVNGTRSRYRSQEYRDKIAATLRLRMSTPGNREILRQQALKAAAARRENSGA